MIGAHRSTTGEFSVRRDEAPLRRVNPSGEVRWVARYTGQDGKRRSAGTYDKKGPCRRPGDRCCAAHAIDSAYQDEKAGAAKHQQRGTISVYARQWLRDHPRSDRTDAEYEKRLRKLLPLDLGAGPLGDMLFADVERPHAVKLVDTLLRGGYAVNGVKSRIGTLSSMWQDALDDGWTKAANPFMGVKVRANDPRATKPKREVVILSFEQMHRLAAHAGQHEPMIRLLSDCGLRLGEMLPLHASDLKLKAGACDEAPACRVTGPHVHLRRRAWCSREYEGTKTGKRVAPLAPELAAMLGARVGGPVPLIGDALVFPNPNGRIWWEADFYRQVWYPAREAAGLEGVTPHMLRHAWVSHIRAAGIDVAAAAAAAGHTVETATRVYTHDVGGAHDQMRKVVGA